MIVYLNKWIQMYETTQIHIKHEHLVIEVIYYLECFIRKNRL